MAQEADRTSALAVRAALLHEIKIKNKVFRVKWPANRQGNF
jgi:hypothetical protein